MDLFTIADSEDGLTNEEIAAQRDERRQRQDRGEGPRHCPSLIVRRRTASASARSE